MSLITPFEVRKYSGAGRDYDPPTLCRLIPQIEQEFVRECLGTELWNYLNTNLTEIPTGIIEWQSCDIYQTDDVVNYFGCIYTSTADNNATIPGETGAEWADFDKFTDDGCNTLWTVYLREVLALKVYNESLTEATFRSTGGGVVVNTGDSTGYRAAKRDEISAVKTAIIRSLERTTTNMIEWLRLNADAQGLPTPFVCAAGGCKTKGSTGRRWGFYREHTRLNLVE